MYLLRAMGALRAGRSVVARPAMRYSQARSAGLGYAQTHAANTFSRYFAAEAGFLDKGEVHDRVMEVVRKFEKVQPEKVTASSHFVNDLGLDSLDAVELVMALEDEFAVEIADTDAEKILSTEDAINFLSSNVNAK